MQPLFLEEALKCLEFLENNTWIGAASCDPYLMHVWESYPDPHARYIPILVVNPMGNVGANVQDSEIQAFRDIYTDLPPCGTPCPLEDLVYILHSGGVDGRSGNHFCVVVFSPKRRCIYLLGRNFNGVNNLEDDLDWDTWQGRRIWRHICSLMGWNQEHLEPMLLKHHNWRQNGVDCGPTSCQVALYIMQHGLTTEDKWRDPQLQCCHSTRLLMVDLNLKYLLDGLALFGRFEDRVLNEAYPGQLMVIEDLKESLATPSSVVHPIRENLRRAMRVCVECHKISEAGRQRDAAKHSPIPVPRESTSATLKRHIELILHGGHQQIEHSSNKEENLGAPQHSELDNIGGDEEQQRQNRTTRNAGIIRQADWKGASLGRFPRPVCKTTIPKRIPSRGIRIPFDRAFDDYEHGPTLEDLAPIPETIMQFQPSIAYIGNRATITPWDLFKDYGYRLMPDFAQTFDLGGPILLQEHLCVVGLPDPPKSALAYTNSTSFDRHGNPTQKEDSIHVGVQEFLNLATKEGSDTVLLTGKTRDNLYVFVDAMRDMVKPTSIHLSCDIDSVIWITQHPQFCGSIGIYSMPVIRDNAPISKTNHVNVEILLPQSIDDQEAIGGRTEWTTQKWSLSTIPHLLCGVLNQITTTVQLLIFFPRMIHRDPHRQFWINAIPSAIQGIFWDKVLLPALQKCTPTTRSPYVPLDRFHSAFKQGKGRSARMPTCLLNEEELPRWTSMMRETVRFFLQLMACVLTNSSCT